MKTFINIGLAATFANLSLATLTNHSPMKRLQPKRALLTCLETYGGGSVNCGGDDSLFCYDPTLGETCCELDSGYCKAGDFCASVAGFCCTVGEDPETCAARLDFTLPPSFSVVPATALPTTVSSQPEASVAPATPSPLTTTSTSTIQISLASAVSAEATIQAAVLTLDTEGMTPQFTAPAGNKMAPDYTAPVNATGSVTATKVSNANLVAFTGAAVANRITEMGGALGLVLAFVGLAF
ncbi:hypothetical protein BKA64DRAFT_768911 [Cadophora sp. MPI-SDFR-AT-0126]|nr:hypothetical protein BKA64DRAFT_768911 [Leotiomycetes sp. MPI-SDFR-AT-0126]